MTKKKAPSELSTTETPAVPRNAMQRKVARDAGHITGWLKNRKRGAPKKTQPPPQKKKKKSAKTAAAKKTATHASVATAAAAAIVDLSGDAAGTTSPPNADTAAANAAASSASASTSNSKKKAEPSKPSRGQYKNWSTEPYASAMSRAIEASLKGLDPQEAAGEIVIPMATLRKRVKDAKAEAKKGKGGVHCTSINFSAKRRVPSH